MSTRRNRKAASVARQTADLALAAPQVVAHRVARMAAAGANPSARDRQEFMRMVAEKQTAFGQAWVAMAWQSMAASQGLALSLVRAWWAPWGSSHAWGGKALAAQWQTAALGVVGKGLAPVRAAAVANARRLSRG